MEAKQGKILINIVESEKTQLNPNSEVASVDGTGNLKVTNPSSSHRLWNLVLNIDDTVMTQNLMNNYKKAALEPNQVWNFDYTIDNLKQPILELKEVIDTSLSDEGINHNFALNTSNNLMLKIILKNVTESPIQDIEIKKQIPEYLREINIESTSLGTTDFDMGSKAFAWKIPSLDANAEASVEIQGRAEIGDSQVKSGNDIHVTYSSDMATRSGLHPTIESLTDTMTGVDSEEDDSQPGVWDSAVEFDNESDFELTIKDLTVAQKIATGEENLVDIKPGVVVPANGSWTHKFKVNGVNVPALTPVLGFTANFNVHTVIKGEIIKAASTFNVLETKVDKAINPPEVNANANTHIEITNTIANVGTADVDKLSCVDLIPRDFEVPELSQITAEIVDAGGAQVEPLRAEKANFKISPNDKELTSSHQIFMEFDSMGNSFKPSNKLIVKYPLMARNPQPSGEYDTPIQTTAYTLPRGPGFEKSTDGVPRIGITYVKRKLKTAKSISPSGVEGVFKISVKITNKGGVELQNLTVKEAIPPGFKAEDFKPEEYVPEFKEGPQGENSELVWKIPILNPGSVLKLGYNCEGSGDFPRFEPIVEVAETASMKGLKAEDLRKAQAEAPAAPASEGEAPAAPEEPSVKVITEGESHDEARLTCPNCSSKKVATKEDRTNPIAYMAAQPIYGKKNYCKDCGWEWK